MTHMITLYLAQFRTTIAEQLQYRAGLVIWMIGLILEPIIYLAVWTTVAASEGGSVDGFTARDFAAYFIATMIVDHATFTWIMWEFEWWVKDGKLSPILLRPVHPIHRQIAQNLTFKLLTLLISLPMALILMLFFRPTFHFEPWSVLAFIVALIGAMALRWMIEWTIAMAAFWTTRVSAINMVYFWIFLFMSGQAAPLALLPGPLAAVAEWLPFYRMLGFPVELFIGRLTPVQAISGIGVQAVWIAAIFVVMNAVWARGVRAYAAVGA